MGRRALQLLISLAGVALLTYAGYGLFPVNATTQGFAYLLLVLIIASIWGFLEASVASVAASSPSTSQEQSRISNVCTGVLPCRIRFPARDWV